MKSVKQAAEAAPIRAALDPGMSTAIAAVFRRHLASWYIRHARVLPWRGIADPYRTWVSEIMLQQTRVAAVIDHYERFLRQFPTVLALALAPEVEVLAAWSGLGYYRRARMLHKAAQFIAGSLNGAIPNNAAELRTLPGVGEYTAAAIASIAFGESVAVVDGNVERVILRVTGRPEESTAAAKAFVARQADVLVPAKSRNAESNAPGNHNQAMMELGATICLPRAPLCLHCPVFDLCRTRGEHATPPRAKQRSQPVAYLFATRKKETTVEVLLEQRDANASLMPGMYELPPLPLDAVEGREPMMRLRHSITNTNYYVGIYAAEGAHDRKLRRAVPAAAKVLHWKVANRVAELPLTGLARKVLNRMDLTSVVGLDTPANRRKARLELE